MAPRALGGRSEETWVPATSVDEAVTQLELAALCGCDDAGTGTGVLEDEVYCK